MNHATLAPPITKENAGEYARRATIARERNRAARKAEILASPDHYARKAVEKEIQKVLRWMETTSDKKEYARLCGVLDRLWGKVFAEVRPTKRPLSRPPMPVARRDWRPAASDPSPADQLLPDSKSAPAPSPALAQSSVKTVNSPSTQDLALAPEAGPSASPPPVPVEFVPAQIAPAPPQPVFASEPVEIKSQRSGPKIYQPHELGAMVCGIGGSRKS